MFISNVKTRESDTACFELVQQQQQQQQTIKL